MPYNINLFRNLFLSMLFKLFSLESPTRTLQVKAPEGIGIESRAGDISASCLKDLKLQSKEGTVSIQGFFF